MVKASEYQKMSSTMMTPTPQKRQRYMKNVNKQHGVTEK